MIKFVIQYHDVIFKIKRLFEQILNMNKNDTYNREIIKN